MLIPDLNLLVYAYNSSSGLHQKAAKWWQEALTSGQPIGLAAIVLQGFLRLLSGRHVVQKPYPIKELLGCVEEWFSFDSLHLLECGTHTFEIFKEMVKRHEVSGSMLSDAWLAALAKEHDATLCSNDTDFLKFKNIRLENPLG